MLQAMREITTGQQAREVSKLDFCYMCGNPFTDTNPSTRDHVPPKKIFLLEDRNWPLILPAHEKCNSEYSFSDEQAKGLLTLLHPDTPGYPPLKTSLIGMIKRDDKPVGVLLEGLSLGTIVHKILRACHAALYHEFLPVKTNNQILLPLPIFDPKTGQVAQESHLPQHKVLCKLLKDNRRISNIDRIQAYNGKFRFEAVWSTADDDETNFAVFGIDIYNWHHLANQVLGRPQGCIGFYRINKNAFPDNASVASKSIELPFTYSELLNPFEE
ncbi:MAG: hypothetical protein A2Z38_09770 [Planctomycetes bacterium RBG_19FT_COMBO_48_8]|nr:MAG: hypothetical protein A2Z38_09770 [Planctomycetes bacterium RBG_19FT_COMBO_48_8]